MGAEESGSEVKADHLDALKPKSKLRDRRNSTDILEALRSLLLTGQLKPGTILTQGDVAERFGVSRTPVREALRVLQQEGLLEGEANQRCRVVGFTPELIDSAYAERILVETLSAAITARKATATDHAAVAASIAAMKSRETHANFEKWQVPHKRFHALITSLAPAPLRISVAGRTAQTQRYRALVKTRTVDGWWKRGEAEHQEIADAFYAGEVSAVVHSLARHLTRSALEILADLAPEYEPVALRTSLWLCKQSSNTGADAESRHKRKAQQRRGVP